MSLSLAQDLYEFGTHGVVAPCLARARESEIMERSRGRRRRGAVRQAGAHYAHVAVTATSCAGAMSESGERDMSAGRRLALPRNGPGSCMQTSLRNSSRSFPAGRVAIVSKLGSAAVAGWLTKNQKTEEWSKDEADRSANAQLQRSPGAARRARSPVACGSCAGACQMRACACAKPARWMMHSPQE